MVKEKVDEVIEKVGESRNFLLDGLHKILLAGIGAVSLAQDEVEDFVNKLIEKGEIAEKDGRKLLDDIDQKRKEQTGKVKKQTEKAEKELDKRLDGLLAKLNVPTKSDIDGLNKKIAALTKKIDELKK
jgi:poly(hydroxyalkanoate) granule-associated protein